MPLEAILTLLDYYENEDLTEGWATNLTSKETTQDWLRNDFTASEVALSGRPLTYSQYGSRAKR